MKKSYRFHLAWIRNLFASALPSGNTQGLGWYREMTPRHRAQLKPCVAWAAIMYEIKLPSLTCQVGWRCHYPLVPFSALTEEDEWQTKRGVACWYPCGVLIQHPLPKFSNAFILMETISAASTTCFNVAKWNAWVENNIAWYEIISSPGLTNGPIPMCIHAFEHCICVAFINRHCAASPVVIHIFIAITPNAWTITVQKKILLKLQHTDKKGTVNKDMGS